MHQGRSFWGLLLTFLASAGISGANTYTWTATPSVVGIATGGSGTWDLTGLNWVAAILQPSTFWGNGSSDVAVFGFSPGVVTLGANNIQANVLQFTVGGYVIAGAGYVLNLSGSSPTISAATGLTETISAPLSSAQTVSFSGGGAINLTGGGSLQGIGTVDQLSVSGANILNLTGAGTTLDVTGTGTLTVSGSSVVNSLGSTSQVDGTTANVTVNGAGSQLHTGFQFLVGNFSTGSLTIQNQGQLNAATYLLIGASNGGNGTLTVQSGGIANSASAILGYVTGATGSATVTGNGSVWNTGALALGGLTDAVLGGAGTLNISNGGAVNVTTATTFWTSTSSIAIDGGTLTTGTLGNKPGFGSIDLQADPAGGHALAIDGATGKNTYDGTITGAGSILKTGASNQILSGANTFTGSTTINGGIITLGNSLALQNSTVVIGVNNGLDLNGLSSVTLGGLSGTGNLNLGATALTVGGNNQSTSYSGAFSATTGIVTKQGSGTLALTGGGSIDSLTVNQGTVAVNGGTLNLTGSSVPLVVVGTGSFTLSGGAVVNSGGLGELVDGTSAAIAVSGAGTKLTTGTEFLISQSASGTLTVQNQGQLTSGVLAVGFDSGSNGSMVIQSGGIVGSDAAGVAVLSGSIGVVNVTGAGSAWNTGSLGIGGFSSGQNGGTGTLTIANGGAVNVTGATAIWNSASSIVINGGTLTTGTLTSNGAVGSINLQADPAGGHALTINGQSSASTYAGTLSGAGGLAMTGSGNTLTLTGANTYTGVSLVSAGTLIQSGGTNDSRITVASGGTFIANNGAVLSPLNGFGAIAAQPGGTVRYDNATLNGGFLSGTGSQTIASGGATFNGTTINLGAVVSQNGAATFNDVTLNGTVMNGAPLLWNGGSIGSGGVLDVLNTVTAGGLTSNGEIDVQPGAQLTVIGTDLALGNGSRTYVGSAAGPGGTIALSGGVVQLDGGLLVNNGTISGEVDVNFGGLAEGAGTYGAVKIGNGGQFHPGNSPGTVTSSSATWGPGGELVLDINDAAGTPGVNWSFWNITGQLSITAGSTPNSRFTIALDSLLPNDSAGLLANFDPTRFYTWNFLSAGSIGGFDPSLFAIDTNGFLNGLGGGAFSLVNNGQNLALDFTPSVPEPSTAVLALGALALAWAARRRCRR